LAKPAYRLAAVTSHPVQYQAPLFQKLAAAGDVDLTVYYGHDGSIAGEVDPEFRVHLKWDRPLLDGYRSVFLQHRSRPLNAIQRLAADAQIMRHLARRPFDAVFIHSYATRLSIFALLGALASRTPILLRSESERLRTRPLWVRTAKAALLRPLFAMIAGFLVIGRANRQFLEDYGVAGRRQFLTPYSVDNEYFRRERARVAPLRRTLRATYGFADDMVVVGFSGKLIPRKRVADLIDAVGSLQLEGQRVALLIVGDGPDRDALEQRSRTRGINSIVFAGFKNQSELAACYECMDVFVLPSGFETWGLVINEAMVFGLPIIASDMTGASADLVEHGGNGYVFRAGSVTALADALRGLAAAPETRQRFGKRSEAIVQGYSYDLCVDGVREALSVVTRGRGRARGIGPNGPRG
jgi:glycosyltransferase involved in cell wall biosynthesis